MNNRAISYVRFSSLPQGEGDSVRRQVDRCRKYCADNGLVLDESEEFTFTDRGRSGYTGANLTEEGELRRFLNMVEDGRVEPGTTLVVESLDRLSRQHVLRALPVLLDLINRDIRVVTLTGGGQVFGKDAPDYALMMAVVEMIRAHEESALKAKRVKAAKDSKLQRARDHREALGAASHPLWLRYAREGKGGRYEVIEERAAVVRRIFDLAVNGRGHGTIANILTAEGAAPFRGKAGDPWSTGSIGRILKNPSVYGVFQPTTMQGSTDGKPRLLDPIPNYFHPIVTEDVFHEAQAAQTGRRNSHATRQTESFNVWSKISKCLHCGGPMNVVNKGKPPKGASYIRCFRATRRQCNATRHVRIEQTEEVFRAMLRRLDSLSLIHDNSAQIERSLRVAEGKLQEQQHRYDRVLADYEKVQRDGGRTADRLLKIMQALDAETAKLEEDGAMLREQLAAERDARWDTFAKDFDLTDYAKRERANRLVQRLGVRAFVAGKNYVVTQGDKVIFGIEFREGEGPGYLTNPFKLREPTEELHVRAQRALREMSGFLPATREALDAFLADEAAGYEQDEARGSDGHPVGEY